MKWQPEKAEWTINGHDFIDLDPEPTDVLSPKEFQEMKKRQLYSGHLI